MTCAVVMARGGSKGLPGKNIRPVGGKPLIAWTLEAALKCPLVNRVVVTTDSQEIADVCRAFGAEVPFLRPSELAQDDTPGMDPLLHAVRWLEDNENYRPELVMLAQATSPLRPAEDMSRAIELLFEKSADAVVSVTPVEEHPFAMKRMDEDGRMTDYVGQENPVNRRQDLPPLYVLNGAIYLVRRDVLLREETFYTDCTYGLIMPPERSIDVDTAWDLYLADLILRDRAEHGHNQG